MKIIYHIVFACSILLGCMSCSKHSNTNNPCDISLGNVYASPYSEPIWHPSGKVIGFNHTPTKSINFGTASKCYIDADYTFNVDSTGFWLINSDGTNQRRILPYTLVSPSWSADGKWLAYSQNGTIYKMPFDGQKLDTNAIVQLSTIGNNVSPTWNYQSNKIAYVETVCNTTTQCGIWLYDSTSQANINQFLVMYGTDPSWLHSSDSFLYHTTYYGTDGFRGGDSLWVYSQINHQKQFLKFIGTPYVNNRIFQASPDDSKIAFVAQSNISNAGVQICTINIDGSNFKQLTTSGAQQFTWGPDGRMVYVDFDNVTIDQSHGVLWIMNADGSNKTQLTYNRYVVINP